MFPEKHKIIYRLYFYEPDLTFKDYTPNMVYKTCYSNILYRVKGRNKACLRHVTAVMLEDRQDIMKLHVTHVSTLLLD